jgi:EAL domain-containing protein (putative c-di-GMP-specific phosphodiesterase class I)
MAVNLSARQLRQWDLIALIRATLAEMRLEAGDLEFERRIRLGQIEETP